MKIIFLAYLYSSDELPLLSIAAPLLKVKRGGKLRFNCLFS